MTRSNSLCNQGTGMQTPRIEFLGGRGFGHLQFTIIKATWKRFTTVF